MVVSANNYSDFVLITGTIARFRDVFYQTFGGTSNFTIYAFFGDICVIVTTFGGPPTSFNTDFPNAIALTSLLTVS